MKKVGVVGLGSMGKRRVRDLLRLGFCVVGYDIVEERARECESFFGIQTFTNEKGFFAASLDALIISVPPDQHQQYYEKSYSLNLPFFSEANIFTPYAEWFMEMEIKYGVKSFPSATWKFHPIFRQIKSNVDEIGTNQINSVIYQYGGYLPYWHPWENYWEFYAGKRKTSAAREMVPFELEWLFYIFGRVKSVNCYKARMGKWKTDIDDSYYLNLIFESNVYATLIIELHQVKPFRTGKISFQEMSMEFDLSNNECIRYDLKSDSYKKISIPGLRVFSSFNFEDIYFEEIKAAIEAIFDNKPYVKSWEEDRHLSDVLFAAERSSAARQWIEVKDICNEYDGFSWE